MLFIGWLWVSIVEKLGGGILFVFIFVSNCICWDDIWVDEGEYEDDEEEYDDEEVVRLQELCCVCILCSVLVWCKCLVEKFINFMGCKIDVVFFFGKWMDDGEEVV